MGQSLRKLTGAKSGEVQVDIDVSGLPMGAIRKTKGGLPEYPIQGNITPDRIKRCSASTQNRLWTTEID
jgi:hypothetical protein